MLKVLHLAALVGGACLISAIARADDIELLTNGGFETGNLTGWIQAVGVGHVVFISGPTALPCAQIAPNVPRTGSFLFSSSTQDGAEPETPEISISQQIDISAFPGVAAGEGSIVASGFFSGALGCDIFTSDDLAQIVLEFYSGGPSGTLVGSASSSTLDPVVGSWNPLVVSTPVPATADTIVVTVRTLLDPKFSAIDIGVDDTSVVLTVPPSIPSFPAYSLSLLCAILFGVARFQLVRRSA